MTFFFFTKGQEYSYVKWAVVLTGVSSATWSLLITSLLGLQWRNRWLRPPTDPTRPLQLFGFNTPENWHHLTRLPKTLKYIKTIRQTKSMTSVLKKLFIYSRNCMFCRLTWLVQGEGGDNSPENAEFDTQTKSRQLALKGFHWRVKRQTESQCDCLSNEKIRALRLTENDLGQKD